ncbi:GNAT family N-acetyltransferase [Luteolibacter marinus]|uniref:GNAT family N-acetyltransferase n=1 Tax=Luteolibacter marinus TaxID=2776705 RepID=UPI0018668771
MNSPTIRCAAPSDSEAIAELLGQLGYPCPAQAVAGRLAGHGEGTMVIVAELGAGIVGFASFHVIPLFHADRPLGRITAMCVRSGCRRRGVGQRLLEAIDELAMQAGCARIEVTSGDHRVEEAHRFYQGCGFSPVDQRFQKKLGDGG